MDRVSVIIPTWNRGPLLEKAVRSALEQTLPPAEVLVCDDGSTDGSRKIIAAIGDERVRWIEGPRAGRPAVPRNRGIRESSGEWLAFLDSDDEWLPEKLEEQLAAAERTGCRAICSNAYRQVPGGPAAGNLLAWNSQRLTFDDLLCVNWVVCSSALLHCSLVPVVAGFPEDSSLTAVEDYALWLRVSTQTDFAFLPRPLLQYRDDAPNSLRSGRPSEWMKRKNVLNDFQAWSREQSLPRIFRKRARRQGIRDAWSSALELLAKTVK